MRRYFAGNRVTLKHIKRVTKPNGRVFIYLAVPGQKLVRLPDVPMDSREFLEAYMKASAAPEPVRKGVRVAEGSIAAAIQAFQQSTTFLTYADGTRRVRRSILSDIADIWGRARITDLRDNHIAADVAKHPGHPGVHRLKAWRGLCRRQNRWCVTTGHRPVRRCGPGRSGAVRRVPRGHRCTGCFQGNSCRI